MNAEDIFNKPLTKRQSEDLLRLKNLPDSKIDYSDIPPLSRKQLAAAFRPGAKRSIIIRLDPDIVRWLETRKEGYSTSINHILRVAMSIQHSG